MGSRVPGRILSDSGSTLAHDFNKNAGISLVVSGKLLSFDPLKVTAGCILVLDRTIAG
jgi:hypothetical protein